MKIKMLVGLILGAAMVVGCGGDEPSGPEAKAMKTIIRVSEAVAAEAKKAGKDCAKMAAALNKVAADNKAELATAKATMKQPTKSKSTKLGKLMTKLENAQRALIKATEGCMTNEAVGKALLELY